MPKYDILLERTYVHKKNLIITAENKDEAIKRGKEMINDLVLSIDRALDEDTVRAMLIFEPAEPIPGTKFNEAHKDNIVYAIERADGYCPCRADKNEDTKCPCKEYRETGKCHCNLYIT